MPIRLNIEIRGMQELQRQLDDFPRMLQRKILRRALRLGANVVRDKARAMVSVRSGKLKRSIRSGVTKDLRAIVSAGRNKKRTTRSTRFLSSAERSRTSSRAKKAAAAC